MATTPICVDADVEARYGATNYSMWSDLDGTWVKGTADSVGMTARKLLARTMATDRIYDYLRASKMAFQLPLTTVPNSLLDCAVKLTGYWISTARGAAEYNKDGLPMSRQYIDFQDAMRALDDITSGKMILDL